MPKCVLNFSYNGVSMDVAPDNQGEVSIGGRTVPKQRMAILANDALADGQPTILLVGRSYNAFPPEASQSVARKLASMGVRVIPGDCLQQDHAGRMV